MTDKDLEENIEDIVSDSFYDDDYGQPYFGTNEAVEKLLSLIHDYTDWVIGEDDEPEDIGGGYYTQDAFMEVKNDLRAQQRARNKIGGSNE